MKTTNLRRQYRAGRSPTPARRASRRTSDATLTQLRERLLRRLLAESDNPVLHWWLKRAAVEAESLAWLTPVPLLVLPALLEEKAREARFYAARQAELRDASREWLSLAE